MAQPSACDGHPGRPAAFSITWSGFSTVRVGRGRSKRNRTAVYAREQAGVDAGRTSRITNQKEESMSRRVLCTCVLSLCCVLSVFAQQSSPAGSASQLGGANIIQTDYNNDGCLDILVLRGGWETALRKSLLRNNCNGTFTDVTVEAGLAEPTMTETAVWVDINNDGFLDLYVGNENGPNQLFLNNGNGTFKDISRSSGANLSVIPKALVAADYDNDGYADLFVSNYQGDSALLHNNHDNTFTDVARQAGVQASGHGFGAWFFDYDNDGRPDILATSYAMSIEESVRTYLGLPHNSATMKLYHNLGNGTFRDVSEETGLNKVFMPMGANFGDVDNDGYRS